MSAAGVADAGEDDAMDEAVNWMKTKEGKPFRMKINDALLKRTSRLADFSDSSDSSDVEF
jgi:hypothetical protein